MGKLYVNDIDYSGYIPSYFTVARGTLLAGQTTITISDPSITTHSTIDIDTDPHIPYKDATGTAGSATIIFPAQQTNVSVQLRIWN